MTFLTDFADQAVLLPVALTVAIVLALSGWRRGALAWIAAVLGTMGVMLALKLVFAACGDAMPVLGINSPSGHTAAAAMTYGGVAAVLGASGALVLALSGGAAVLFGISRIAIGAHSLPEVVVGAIAGVIGAVLVARLAGPRPARLRGAVLLVALIAVLALFHGVHLHAEPTIGRLGRLLEIWPLSACRRG